ncbi:MAG TPA: GNAT family N-acetyltransferase [Candidatus Limnocylindrales bacterium]|nr:GNAT family N-acetyltransferase [Candidatus Limnocylindrales bacterium]
MDGALEAHHEPPREWDEHSVDLPGGHVYQSLAWARHRASTGWQPRFIVVPGGPGVLALLRPWPWIGGFGAYIPRGPSLADAPEAAASTLLAVTERLADEGVDVVAADPEVPAASAYPQRIAAAGYHPIEEIQPSRHRIALPVDGLSEETALARIAKSTRQRIRKAEGEGIVVVRHDARLVRGDVGEGFTTPGEPSQVALDAFYDLLEETGERRQFSFGPRSQFVAWWQAAHRAGHLVYLEARSPGGEPLAGLLLYRHGRRLSTVHSGDHAASRRDHPGALHLLRWRAIQLAIREGRVEMDLGGADVAGARREPREGEPMWGLYQHKLSFGGTWVELAGAHEKVLRPNRYRAGRITAGLTRRLGRRG